MVHSYQPLLAPGVSCVQTLRQGVFILRDKTTCSVSKHALGTSSSRFPECEVSPAACYLFLFFAADSGWCFLCTGGGCFSLLEFVSPASLEPVPAEQGFSSFSQCKELNHPMSSEKPPCWQGKPSDLLESVNEIREQASINLVNRCIDLNSLESMFNTSG